MKKLRPLPPGRFGIAGAGLPPAGGGGGPRPELPSDPYEKALLLETNHQNIQLDIPVEPVHFFVVRQDSVVRVWDCLQWATNRF